MKVSLCGTAASGLHRRRISGRNISYACDARGRRSPYAYDDSGRLCMAATSFGQDFDKETNLNYNYFRINPNLTPLARENAFEEAQKESKKKGCCP